MADGYLPPDQDVDFSVIRTAIDMGPKVLDQILNGLHYGSAEVRTLLQEECDFIMECKVCRNLFRSFPNFVAHKRVYCRQPYTEVLEERENGSLLPRDTETVVVQPEPVPEMTSQSKPGPKKQSTSEKKQSSPKKGESKQTLIEQVVNQSFNGKSDSYHLYTKAAEKCETSRALKEVTSVKLTTIPSNANAVLVRLSKGDLTEEMETSDSDINVSKIRNRAQQSPQKKKDIQHADSVIPKKKVSVSDICKDLATHRVTSNLQSIVNLSVKSPGKTIGRSRKSSPRRSTDSFISMAGSHSPMEVETSTLQNTKPTEKSKPAEKSKLTDKNKLSEKDKPVETQKLDEMDPMPAEILLQICDMKKLMCKRCDRTFTTASKLKFHARMKHVGSLYNCTTCEKSFVYLTTLADHLRRDHKKSEATILRVRESYMLKKKLEMSMLTAKSDASSTSAHSPAKDNKEGRERSYWKKCDKCGKTFRRMSSYHNHVNHCKVNRSSGQKSSNSPEKTKPASASGSTQGKVTEIIVHPPTKPTVVKSFKSVERRELILQDVTKGVKGRIHEKDNSEASSKNVGLESSLVVMSSSETTPRKVGSETIKSSSPRKSVSPTESDDSGNSFQGQFEESTGCPMVVTRAAFVSGKHERSSPQEQQTDNRRGRQRDSSQGFKSPKLRLIGRRSLSSDRAFTLNELKTNLKEQHLTQADAPHSEDEVNEAELAGSKSEEEEKKMDVEESEKSRELKRLEKKLVREALGGQPIDGKQHKAVLSKDSRMSDSVDKNLKQSDSTNMPEKSKAKPLNSRPKASCSKESSVSSCPTSPMSVSSSSCDGYNSKFKMTVKEMAELVETASLTKFAKERKKRARNVLNAKHSKVKKNLEGALARPMKRQVRIQKVTVVRKVYGTRHSTGSIEKDNTDDRSQDQDSGGAITRNPRGQFKTLKNRQSRGSSASTSPSGSVRSVSSDRLAREIKRLENSEGFATSRQYAGSLPSLPLATKTSADVLPDTDRKAARVLARLKNSQGFHDRVKNPDGATEKRVPRERSIDSVDGDRIKIKDSASVLNDRDLPVEGKIDVAKSDKQSAKGAVKEQDETERDEILEDSHGSQCNDEAAVKKEKKKLRELAKLEVSVGFVDKTSQKVIEKQLPSSRSRVSNVALDKSSGSLLDSSQETNRHKSLSDESSTERENDQSETSKLGGKEPNNCMLNIEKTTENVKTPESNLKRSSVSNRLDGKKVADSLDGEKATDSVGVKKVSSPGIKQQKSISDFFRSNSSEAPISAGKEVSVQTAEAGTSPDFTSMTKMNSMRKMMLAQRRSVNISSRVMNQTSPLGNPSTDGASKSLQQKVKKTFEEASRKSAVSNIAVERCTTRLDASSTVTSADPRLPMTNMKTYSDEKSTVHRTRLATGSIIFDKEQFKTSPKKTDQASGSEKGSKEEVSEHLMVSESAKSQQNRKGAVERLDFNSIKSPRSPEKRQITSPNVARAQTSVITAKATLQQAQTKSATPGRFPLDKGVKQCDVCGQVFWKSLSYKKHLSKETGTCRKARKRSLSQSQAGNETESGKGARKTGEVTNKKAKIASSRNSDGKNVSDLHENETDKLALGVTDIQSVGEIASDVDRNLVTEQKAVEDSAEAVTKSVTKSGASPKKHANIIQDSERNVISNDSWLDDDSSSESEFVGFSEEDFVKAKKNLESLEQKQDDDSADVSLNSEFFTSDDDEPSDTDSSETSNTDKLLDTSSKSDESAARKIDGGRDKAPKIKHYFTFVRDAECASKIVCHSYKDVLKIIDVEKIKCLQCDTPCTNLSNLRRHAINHLGWKRYKCLVESCTFNCYDMSQIRLHSIRSHDQKLVKGNFHQFVLDLKKEATKKNIARRVRSMRIKKENEKLSKEELYSKPRKPFKKVVEKGAEVVAMETGQSESATNNNDGESKKHTPSDAKSPLLKARISLSKALQN